MFCLPAQRASVKRGVEASQDFQACPPYNFHASMAIVQDDFKE